MAAAATVRPKRRTQSKPPAIQCKPCSDSPHSATDGQSWAMDADGQSWALDACRQLSNIREPGSTDL